MQNNASNKEIVSIVIDELQKRNIIKNNYSTFKNTEQILFDFPKLKASIEARKEQIKDYRDYGLPNKSKSITAISHFHNYQEEEDIISNSIKNLEKNIYKTQVAINFISKVLEKFKDDPYYQIIQLYFFERKTYEQIAEIFDRRNKHDKSIATSTISTNKNRLIREIQKYIFPNDYLYNLLGY